MQITKEKPMKVTKANPIIKYGRHLVEKPESHVEHLKYIAAVANKLYVSNRVTGVYQAKPIDIEQLTYLLPTTGRRLNEEKVARLNGDYPYKQLQKVIDQHCEHRDTEVILKKNEWEEWIQVHKDFADYHRYDPDNLRRENRMVKLEQNSKQFRLTVKVASIADNHLFIGGIEGKWTLPLCEVDTRKNKDVGTIAYNAEYMVNILKTLAEYKPETIHITYNPTEPTQPIGISAYDKNRELLARGVIVPIRITR